MFANHIFGKGLISKIHKELIRLNNTHTQSNLKTGKGLEQSFFQKIHTDDQQLHERCLVNITNQQENANQNHRITSHLLEQLLSKRQEVTSVGKDMEKGKPLRTVGGNANWCSHYGKTLRRFLIRLKIEWPHPAILLPDVYLDETSTLTPEDICIPTCVADSLHQWVNR